MTLNNPLRSALVFIAIAFMVGVACTPGRPRLPSIIEIVEREDSISKEEMLRFAEELRLDSSALYHWKNRWVLQVARKRVEQVKAALVNRFPGEEIKLYPEPFYRFTREENCNEKPVPRWSYTIMTANLVDDRAMQDEYMEYHRQQFEEWPEVSTGFCNASFQQLLVYRNGRQLMLVIAIPAGESLDALNPRTTENNPRVEEWNNIMSKYQEGVDGAPDGVVWVELKQVKK